MPQSPDVRTGDETHLDAIIAYDDAARSAESERATELREAAASGRLTVAIHDGRVVGHGIVRRRVFFGLDFLDLVYVADSARRVGIGRLLVRWVRREANDRMWTSTNLSNAPMHGLLLSEGWRPAGMLDGLDEGDPEVFYRADVSTA